MPKADLHEWRQKLEIAHRKFKTVKPKIERAWSYYKGQQWNSNSDWGGLSLDGYKDKTVDNVIFTTIRSIVPGLNTRNPKIFVRPKKKPFMLKSKNGQPPQMFDTIAASVYVELVLNYYYKVLEVKREARKCLYDALLSPFAIMDLGYTLKTSKEIKGELIDVNELIEEDSPYCIRRSPFDFRQDPECKDPNLHDAKWVAFRWVKELDDVKKDGKFTNTRGLKANHRVKTEFTGVNQGMKTEEMHEDPEMWGRVEGWDIWDKKNHQIMTLVKDHDKFLRFDKEWPLELDGFPCETLYFNENATDVYPIPESWLVLDLQDELNRIGSMQLDHIRRISQRRYIARRSAFTAEEIRKLTHGGDGTVAETDLLPQDSILPLQDATISQDLYMIRNGLKQVIQGMMGVSPADILQASKFESATEPALIQQGVMTIRGDQQQTFEEFTVRVIEKLSKIIQQTADEIEIPLTNEDMHDEEISKFVQNKLVKVAGPQGGTILQPWLQVEKNDIQGDYIYDIEVGSTMPVNEQAMRQDAISLYQLLKDNPFIRGREGTKELLTAFDRTDPEKMLKPEEQVAKEHQQQVQEAVQTEAAMQSPKHQTDLQKTKMKSETAVKVAAIKSATSHQQVMTASDDNTKKMKAGFLTEMLRMRQRPTGGGKQ